MAPGDGCGEQVGTAKEMVGGGRAHLASEDGQKQEVRKGGGGASPVAKVVKPKVVKDDEGDMSPDYDDDYDGEDNVLGELLGGGDDEYL